MYEELMWVAGLALVAWLAYTGLIVWGFKRFFDFIDKQGL